ncbi:coiled-coil domain-containing protein [Capsaspora owczarzaki ATCC 30864]|uniref:Coiled-coil domain-containing protein n=1 Tax=Capsaspora owczarzaki (strain ATCC 30864) TaxID=595528 RepID=A0A0D2WVS2_CAPO3|nr:coiled-coil domain-containing protein [Capsaspora owczarzaki ATCC 30864]KJE96388.1 coiled-coil domain-containing protein [Capsaspora owczarzaki ATCC 30864]|eukprot:XP_004344341.1 coiled-coil domain-containing protein [Capsaspora owczarzaki ATCC 30864]
MADRRAQQKYYPPDWDPSKGSINTYMGQHPLRDRARKLSEGILIVRFELPFNIWCGGCNAHVALGVRFNAQKKQVGKYLSTPILSFRMKCHLCDNWWTIQTDPKTHNYLVMEGARRRNQEFSAADIEAAPQRAEADERKKLDNDPMYKLEHGVVDATAAKKARSHIDELLSINEMHKDDFDLNSLARKRFRQDKAVIKEDERERAAFRSSTRLYIPAAPESAADATRARQVFRGQSSTTSAVATPARDSLDPERRIAAIQGESIFARAAKDAQKPHVGTTPRAASSSSSSSAPNSAPRAARPDQPAVSDAALAALQRMRRAGSSAGNLLANIPGKTSSIF